MVPTNSSEYNRPVTLIYDQRNLEIFGVVDIIVPRPPKAWQVSNTKTES